MAGAQNATRILKLNNGFLMPNIGVGTYLLNGFTVKAIVDKALFYGYRHIDSAISYDNEKDIGQIVRDNITAGKYKREDLFITTKLPSVYHAPEDVDIAIQKSKENLDLSYIDMFLIHQPWRLHNHKDGNLKPTRDDGELDFCPSEFIQTWKALEKCVDDGHVRSIGVSNFTVKQLQTILDNCKIKPANVQLECHPFFQQHELQTFCESHDIKLTAYSPLGAPGRPQSSQRDKNEDVPEVLKDLRLKQIAEYHKKATAAQISLAWLIKRGFCVLPKASSEERLEENIDIYDIELTGKDMKIIKGMDLNLKYFTFKKYQSHPEFFLDEDF